MRVCICERASECLQIISSPEFLGVDKGMGAQRHAFTPLSFVSLPSDADVIPGAPDLADEIRRPLRNPGLESNPIYVQRLPVAAESVKVRVARR